jgi:signal recognition particle receptor subunit beta
MSIINYASREIQFKIVYYGPALCGKTTNLGYIHQRINPQNRGDLVSLATASDRTLFFDFLPLNAIVIKGFVTKFQLYTVPGQVIYNATRQLVLRSVDGVVFVADSQWEKMEENVESFKNLEENMAKQNMSLDDVPYVLQYNKRDLTNIAPVNYLEYVLNNRKKRVQNFEVISSTGQNVFATLNAVSQILLHKFSRQSDIARAGSPVATLVPPPPQNPAAPSPPTSTNEEPKTQKVEA